MSRKWDYDEVLRRPARSTGAARSGTVTATSSDGWRVTTKWKPLRGSP